MQVKCITLNPPGFVGGGWLGGCKIEVGGIYEVVDTLYEGENVYYELSHHAEVGYASKLFEPYNAYSNSVSKALAELAMKTVIEIDHPVKELQPQVN